MLIAKSLLLLCVACVAIIIVAFALYILCRFLWDRIATDNYKRRKEMRDLIDELTELKGKMN